METAGAMNCDTCQKSYESSDTSPTCLSCGHIFCSTCISSLTSTKIKCPNCNAIISVLSAEDIDLLNTTFYKSPSTKSLHLPEVPGKNKDVSLEGETTQKSIRDSFDAVNINPIPQLNSDEEGATEQMKLPSSFPSTGEDEEKTEDLRFIDEESCQEYPMVLTQSCEYAADSEYRQRKASVNSWCNAQSSLCPDLSNLATEELDLHNTSICRELEKSTDDVIQLVADSTDLRSERSVGLSLEQYISGCMLMKDNISEQTQQQLLDVKSDIRKDSLVVHHSNSCDFDSVVEARETDSSSVHDCDFRIIKNNELQKFADQVQILHEVLETVDDAILTLKVEEKHHESTKHKLLQQLQEEEESIESLKAKMKEAERKKMAVQHLAETLQEGEETTAAAESAEELQHFVDRSSATMALAEDVGTKTELYYMQYLLSRNVHKPEYLERMIDLGEEVFAEYLVEGERRWARISLSDSLIHLHALKPKPPPSKSRILPWSCLREMVSTDKAATFLDISVAGIKQGRVYLSMHGNTPRAQQFVLLSSGEHRHCYRKVKMKQVGNIEQPGEYVSFHGPKNAKGFPIRGAVSGITQGGIHTRRKSRGLLAGAALSHRQRTLFVVYLSPDPDEDTTGAFGEVTRGIEVLSKVSRHSPVEEVELGDCGLIIPLPSSAM
ncbi:uncharacterized protein LOC135217492 [Macrobrachium nipponense]|uniref:uncharacterized protein LOC135217492 n=1 Tax=Macrobrachium nipponense TaxID=159736 RepID=UPI0030C7F107